MNNNLNNYTASIPSYTIGTDAINNIDKICKPYGKYMVVIGGKTALEKAKSKLEHTIAASSLEIVEMLWYGGECNASNIERLLEQLKDKAVDMILGVGGGRALDTAKAVANKLKKPIFTLPTIASTCAATTKLSVVYNDQGVFDTFYFYEKPPVHVFIDIDIIAQSPYEYLRAGMGDTIAKHYECTFASRGKELDHNSGLAKAMSQMCVTPLLTYGEKALKDSKQNTSSYEVEQVILANIVTTGFVSMFVEEDYNGAVAHSVFYGFTLLPHIEERYLHGDVVAYGVLVQLLLDKNKEEANKLYEFYKNIGIPTCLDAIEVENTKEVLMPILENILMQPDMEILPYEVTTNMLWDAIQEVEKLG